MADTSNGQFIWHDHMTRDPEAAIAFYGEVIGWSTEPAGDDYVMWVGKQGPLGGVMALPDAASQMGVPPNWMGYVQVDDVDATCALTTRRGGKVHKEPSEIPEVGRFAVLGDPQGATFCVFAPSRVMTRHDPAIEGEVCWNELMTSDGAAGFAFYAELFGWKTIQEMDMGPMGTYRVFGLGEQGMGGMMTKPPGAPMPSTWLFYFETGDLDAAIARATKRGAKVMNGPIEVPGPARIAQLMDPQGAVFALHELGKK